LFSDIHNTSTDSSDRGTACGLKGHTAYLSCSWCRTPSDKFHEIYTPSNSHEMTCISVRILSNTKINFYIVKLYSNLLKTQKELTEQLTINKGKKLNESEIESISTHIGLNQVDTTFGHTYSSTIESISEESMHLNERGITNFVFDVVNREFSEIGMKIFF
jgi:hypothetical protein